MKPGISEREGNDRGNDRGEALLSSDVNLRLRHWNVLPG